MQEIQDTTTKRANMWITGIDEGEESQVNGWHRSDWNRIIAADSAPNHWAISPALGKYFIREQIGSFSMESEILKRKQKLQTRIPILE